jgi:hypothetical protein
MPPFDALLPVFARVVSKAVPRRFNRGVRIVVIVIRVLFGVGFAFRNIYVRPLRPIIKR